MRRFPWLDVLMILALAAALILRPQDRQSTASANDQFRLLQPQINADAHR